jgi:hypothetical protein
MKPRTFADIYCEREGLSPAAMRDVLLQRTLYPHARLIVGLGLRLVPRFFRADFEFIDDVGCIRNLQDFSLVLGGYIEHPTNRSFLRRRLRLRISARRMLRIVRAVLAPAGRDAPETRNSRQTLAPFGRSPAGPAGPAPAGNPSPAPADRQGFI